MMWKTSFGDSLRSKTEIAMKNELYCKLICHNLSCLIKRCMSLALVRSFWRPVFRRTLLTDGDPYAQGARRRSAASRPRARARSGGLPGRRSSSQQTIGLHGTIAKACKSGGEGTFSGTHGNGKVAPIPAVRCATIEPPEWTPLDLHDRAAGQAAPPESSPSSWGRL
jgi:hypothetical protein